ncbi:hypothetical protein VTL71DRAFT_10655 [Oculimacula yallundae]|uniref:Protein kinase domain-containing protein n=1 Tax=Oculimacula yallundae TaxID=86028 RepID=A0ABR4CTR2_9HELO
MSSDTETSPSDSSSTGEECLSDLISKTACESVLDGRVFFPEECIDACITKEAVMKELAITEEDSEDGSKRELLRYVLTSGKRTFAILVDINLAGKELIMAMEYLMVISFGDSSLPITAETVDSVFFMKMKKPVRPWTIKRVRDFRWKQFGYIAPVFAPGNMNMHLHAKTIFPFIFQGNDSKTGAIGEVSQVGIHPSHHRNPIMTYDNKQSKIAVKKITRSNSNDEAELRALKAEWKNEVDALIDISKCNDGRPHPNIIEFVAAVTRGHDHYLLFRWADGGNLHEYWQDNRRPQLSVSLVRDVVTQLHGLADALKNIHEGGLHCHGDLKPKNILRVRTRFVTEGSGADFDVGILKIADMGLAKHDTVQTEFRPQTSMKYSTFRDEPLEVVLKSSLNSGGKFRRQDIWSFGCVTLEFVVWLLYGTSSLDDFNEHLVDETDKLFSYFEINGRGNKRTAIVYPAVTETMEMISKDKECKAKEGSAMKDLLDIVRTKLVVLSRGSGNVSCATAGEVCDELGFVTGKGKENTGYWFTGKYRNPMQGLPKLRSFGSGVPTLTSALEGAPPLPNKLTTSPLEDITRAATSVTQSPGDEYRNAEKIDITNFPIENVFAAEVVRSIDTKELFPSIKQSPERCKSCRSMNLSEPRFTIKETWESLQGKLDICDFCKLRWDVSKHLRTKKMATVIFTRDESMLKLNEGRLPVMSICRSPETQITNANFIQIGLPILSAAASNTHLNIVRHFIRDCDANHPKCVPPMSTSLPTRLLDLGSPKDPTIRVYTTKKTDSFHYVALSHRWGPGPVYFCTDRTNLKEYEKQVCFESLPNTFKNAVTTTRELGQRYLWIDSLCIIQGDDGDFAQEALRMEAIFSSAYCILAASSATGPTDGFLAPRKANEFLTFDIEGQPVYVCKFRDDFEKHVLRGPLSQRGWVMQERALARRTIFFTDIQTQLISFLGDPNFPSKIATESSDRGARIRLYEDFYRLYSRLDFTRWSDRLIAIAGLERRLLRDLDVEGGFGVFDDDRSFLQRSLLWRKGQGVSVLERITLTPEEPLPVPTWSWMGYKSAIDYLDLPLGKVDWTPAEIISPWKAAKNAPKTVDGESMTQLKAMARTFAIGEDQEGEISIIYDRSRPSDAEEKTFRCVVLGRLKEAKPIENTQHYVLLIEPVLFSAKENMYRRAGVGYMPGKHIDLRATDQSQMNSHIPDYSSGGLYTKKARDAKRKIAASKGMSIPKWEAYWKQLDKWKKFAADRGIENELHPLGLAPPPLDIPARPEKPGDMEDVYVTC